jgi:hypothetical protein
MKLFRRKKKPTYSYHPNPIGRVELAKKDMYISYLENELSNHAPYERAVWDCLDLVDSLMDGEPCDCDRCQTLAMVYAMLHTKLEGRG